VANSPDELQYTIPHDILHYEPRYWFGLTITDMLYAALPAMLILSTTNSALGAGVSAALSLAALKRFDYLGNRSFLQYMWGWFRENRKREQIYMPRVMPIREATLQVLTWDDDEIFRLESDR